MPDPAANDGSEMGEEERLAPTVVSALYAEHADQLRQFLLGLLRDHQLAGDVLQATFAKALEQGHKSKEETRKAWLFRVAYNEAMLVRRKQGVDGRAREKLSWVLPKAGEGSDESAVRSEVVERTKAAIEELSEKQQQVLRLRIYEEMTFAQIADHLGIPLGTALARMRAATQKLREALADESET